MATFNPNSYGSKKSKIYTAGGSGGASAAQNKETSAPAAFDPSRYGSRTSKLYTPSRRGAPSTYKPDTSMLVTPSVPAETQQSIGREVGDIAALGAGNYGADKRPNSGYN